MGCGCGMSCGPRRAVDILHARAFGGVDSNEKMRQTDRGHPGVEQHILAAKQQLFPIVSFLVLYCLSLLLYANGVHITAQGREAMRAHPGFRGILFPTLKELFKAKPYITHVPIHGL
jgi:hypothetical protein